MTACNYRNINHTQPFGHSQNPSTGDHKFVSAVRKFAQLSTSSSPIVGYPHWMFDSVFASFVKCYESVLMAIYISIYNHIYIYILYPSLVLQPSIVFSHPTKRKHGTWEWPQSSHIYIYICLELVRSNGSLIDWNPSMNQSGKRDFGSQKSGASWVQDENLRFPSFFLW